MTRLDRDAHVEVTSLTGLTNHAIGEEAISGGIKLSGPPARIVTLTVDCMTVLTIRLEDRATVDKGLWPALLGALDEAFGSGS